MFKGPLGKVWILYVEIKTKYVKLKEINRRTLLPVYVCQVLLTIAI